MKFPVKSNNKYEISICYECMREHVVIPVLQHLVLPGGFDAVDLIVNTAIAESDLTHRSQIGGGPSVGLWQITQGTHDDVWENYLAYRPKFSAIIRKLLDGEEPHYKQAKHNDAYACAIARVIYWRIPEPLPAEGDIKAQAAYWKQHYNTAAGAGTEADFILRVERHLQKEREERERDNEGKPEKLNA